MSLLNQPTFTHRKGRATLPGVLALLSTEDEVEWPYLQAHQAHVWHMFLVQLATIALERAGAEDVFRTEPEWREALATLVDDPSAWCVEEPDLSRPAFLQPPLPDGPRAFTKVFPTPDAMDVLSTAKNHDVKRFRVVGATDEHWLYALIAVQTSSGLLGRGNYGVTRMDGGYASRACVGFVHSLRAGERFREDVRRLLSRGLDDLLERGFRVDGPALLWTLPWGPGRESLPLDDLHPLFIEVCRRIRRKDGVWHGGTTDGERIGAKALKGDVGDPWLPIKPDGGALNVQATGFDYKLLVDLLSNDVRIAPFMGPTRDTRWLACAVLAGQQGGTNGFHQRMVEIPPRAASLLSDPEGRERVVERAAANREDADTARRRCLMPALLRLLDEEPKSGAGYRRYLRAFDLEVDDRFFDVLWPHMETDPETARKAWVRELRAIGTATLERAARSVPQRAGTSYKRRAAAASMFAGTFNKNFPRETP